MNRIFYSFIFIILIINQSIILKADNDTYINTSNITFDNENNRVELAENSKINIKNINLLIDKGIIDYENDSVEVFGNFYLYQELNILSGKDLVGKTSMNEFSAIDVSYIYKNDLKIDSDKVERSDNNLIFYNNFLTPCELEGFFNCPTWSLKIEKTKYMIDEDKFNHYDTFLQIADYKVFYLPYFTHYGVKAPRKKGFLTPSVEFSIGGDLGLITPYYLPLNENTEITFKPKIITNSNFTLSDKYEFNTIIKHKSSGGNVVFDIYNEEKNNSELYTSAKLTAKQVLNKKNILSYEALITNSVSTTRSINDEPLSFEDIFIRLDSYDILRSNDFLSSEISTVEALDKSNNSFIPLSPSVSYISHHSFSNASSIFNNLNLKILKREESNSEKPSESFLLKMNNQIFNNKKSKYISVYNKLNILNNYNNYDFKHNTDLNDEAFQSNLIFSSDIHLNNYETIKPRVKYIQNLNLISDKIINEDSKSITFNYQNQYSDNRFYGTDLIDDTGRIVYGFESIISPFEMKKDINLYVNQSYDFNKKTNYTKEINQQSNFSDIAFEAKTRFSRLDFSIDSRLDNKNYSKKEMNYSLEYDDEVNLAIEYNETSFDSFKSSSSNTKTLSLKLGKDLNKNSSIFYGSNLDIKDNYSPYSQFFKLSLFDECSKLEISYLDERYNDNYNTKPSETISLSFYMDYLGFFGYEQKTNLFYEESKNF